MHQMLLRQSRQWISGLAIALLMTWNNPSLAREDYFTPDELPPKENLHLYLLMGQENMVGRGVISKDDREPHPRVIMMNDKLQWIPAVDPLHRRNPMRDGVGPGFSFAKYLAEQDETVTIGLIPCAVEGSSLKHWEKGNDLYVEALLRAKEATKVGTIKGVIWHQGEWDARQRAKAATYGIRLGNTIRDFRRDLGEAKLPFIVGELGTFVRPNRLPFAKLINEALQDIPHEIPYTECVETKNLHRRDLDTFNAEGARELGVRYAKAMLDAQSKVRQSIEDSDSIQINRDFIGR
ncbi:MAG: sialate O-acetylesterase [Planctomycetota bacterium]|nr:sialate O-acetylesterase [Planctomycetota bacterium]MDA1211779.1 sialate O-acetylesterase [Planctomycetota bacterium]